MKIEFAVSEDLAGFLKLQAKYLYTNLSEQERKSGFVTTPFTESQFQHAISNDGLIVAKHENIIVGYIFCGSWDYFSEWPIFPALLSKVGGEPYDGIIISEKNSFQYGPVCIDLPFRKKDLLSKLFEFMRISMSKQYSVGITFINVVNENSFHAHTKKLKLDVIDHMEFNDNEYFILAFNTSKPVL